MLRIVLSRKKENNAFHFGMIDGVKMAFQNDIFYIYDGDETTSE